MVFHRAGEMALGDVRNFVRHYRRQLAFIIRVAEQGRVQYDVTAEESKGVYLIVINQIKVERGANGIGVRHQAHA